MDKRWTQMTVFMVQWFIQINLRLVLTHEKGRRKLSDEKVQSDFLRIRQFWNKLKAKATHCNWAKKRYERLVATSDNSSIEHLENT